MESNAHKQLNDLANRLYGDMQQMKCELWEHPVEASYYAGIVEGYVRAIELVERKLDELEA